MLSIEWRLRLRHWFKKYGKIFLVVFIVWSIIFFVNVFLKDYTIETPPTTTYEPKVSIMDTTSSVSTKVHLAAEDMIAEYVEYCNDGNYQKAFNMLTEDCRKYAFGDDIGTFADYVLTKMPTKKQYSIQNYSNYKGYNIYEIKYIDDFLATGLTNQTYNYSTEKIVISKNSDGTYNLATGNFISHDDVKRIAENEYLKIDVIDKVVRYSVETYTVRFTNRTDSTIVVADTLGENEVALVLSGEYRQMTNIDTRIILRPGGTMTVSLDFMKFADDGDATQGMFFGAVRVIEDYKGESGTEEERKNEIDNAIAKFSMEVGIK